ncbi:MAG: FAD-dependent oxidoreductase [Pedobacter sp.]|nr:MAG: FAD-dependent oxidoreductase [Pedobacter sp.]
MRRKPDIFIIGGGIAGLTNAILLSRAGFKVRLAERKTFPYHRVCGEYVSNEALPFLGSIGLKPDDLNAAKINKLVVSAPSGRTVANHLNMGGFGLSRYALDNRLYELALQHGVEMLTGVKVDDVTFSGNDFSIVTAGEVYQADLVIGAWGKRSNLDQKLERSFFKQRSPYMGVKYHIKTRFAEDTIRLDNFSGGYCGLNKIEDDLYCLCYLSENKHLKRYGSIAAMEEEVLMKNPFLKEVFANSDFIWQKPETINEVAFENKPLVDQHILMAGDSAGMITPLCGNGMAMAFHSAKILSGIIRNQCTEGFSNTTRNNIEDQYQKE